MPSSQVLLRWISPVARITTQIGAERPGAGHPQLRRTGHVADVGLPAEDQDVEVVGLHLGQRPLAPPGAQSAVVGQDLSRHRPPVRGVGVVGESVISRPR